MQVVYERCCGLDVHKKMIVACLSCLNATGQRRKEIRTFSTMTADLLQLLDWLNGAECTHVALESTGVYWKPIFNLLESHVEVWLVNAHHIKAVPGRKTDIKDAEWIADLLQHGLLRPSFIPPAPQHELRELTRYRASLVADRARLVNRLHKGLEDTNLKLAAVVTDITGVSARAILRALLAGETDPTTLAQLARGRLRRKQEQLAQALVGTLQDHHRSLLTTQLALLDVFDQQIAAFDRQIAARISRDDDADEDDSVAPRARSLQAPASSPVLARTTGEPSPPDVTRQGLPGYAASIRRLDAIPGVNQRIAEVVLAEVGNDMSRFPSAGHLASWAGLCPGSDISAGKRLSSKAGKENRWVRQALVEAAHGAAHSKETFLGERYRRLSKRLGRKKAILAVAHSILGIIYHLLNRPHDYCELGSHYFDEKEQEALKRRSIRRLEQLGYHVILADAQLASLL
jgi:transposase